MEEKEEHVGLCKAIRDRKKGVRRACSTCASAGPTRGARMLLGADICLLRQVVSIGYSSALCTMLLRLSIGKRAWREVAMDGAPIQPCHRRAPRHPVPQVPERAFIVTRA